LELGEVFIPQQEWLPNWDSLDGRVVNALHLINQLMCYDEETG
jgi:hypothetical protein